MILLSTPSSAQENRTTAVSGEKKVWTFLKSISSDQTVEFRVTSEPNETGGRVLIEYRFTRDQDFLQMYEEQLFGITYSGQFATRESAFQALAMMDVNFDGFKDVRIFYSGGSGGSAYQYFTYQTTYDDRPLAFEENDAMWRANINRVDREKESLFSSWHYGAAVFSGAEYKWIQGHLIMIRSDSTDGTRTVIHELSLPEGEMVVVEERHHEQ
jgi:hypothetical protein